MNARPGVALALAAGVTAAACWQRAAAQGAAGAAAPSVQRSPYAAAIRAVNPALDSATAGRIAALLSQHSARYGVDPNLVFAIVAVESRFDPAARSPAGGVGLGGLLPAEARAQGVRNPNDIGENLRARVQILARYLKEQTAPGRPPEEVVRRAVACINAGPGRVRQADGVPPLRETQNYVRAVLQRLAEVRARLAGAGGTDAGGLRRSILFVVDVSGSMAGRKIEAARKAVADLVGRAPGGTEEWAILAFSNHNVLEVQAFSQDAEQVRRSAASLQAAGDTPLRYAQAKGAAYLMKNGRAPQGSLVILCDGDDNCPGPAHAQGARDDRAASDAAKTRLLGVFRARATAGGTNQ